MWSTYAGYIHFLTYLTLVALMAGEAAFQAEEESDERLITEMTAILARIHHKDFLPRPVQSMVSRWRKDPFARGSYSFIGPEATGKDYDLLGEPVDLKLFFAGEATCRTHPATVHGAYMSGLRAAAEVLESFVGKIELPPDDVLIPMKHQPVRNPLIEKSSIPHVRRRTDPESHRYKAKNIRRSRFSKIVEECSARIITELGPKPAPPKKYHPNAFLLFQKDKWDIARERANKAKTETNPEIGELASRDEVRASMGRMWRDLPEDEKRLYNEAVEREKLQYKEEISTFSLRLEVWEKAVLKIKEDMKAKLEEVDLTGEERAMVLAAREEERLEVAAKEEKEKLKRFYGEVGMDDLFPDEEEEKSEV
jgi:Flavin containing amine oxidoreductase/HMG (high mobility group) box